MLDFVHKFYFFFASNLVLFNQDTQKYKISLPKVLYLAMYELVIATCYVAYLVRRTIRNDKFYMFVLFDLNAYIWLAFSIALSILIAIEDRKLVTILNEIHSKAQNLINSDIDASVLTLRIDKNARIVFFLSALYFGPFLGSFLVFVIKTLINIELMIQLSYHMVSVQFILRHVYILSILGYFYAYIQVFNQQLKIGLNLTNNNILAILENVDDFWEVIWKFQINIQFMVFFCWLFITYMVSNFLFVVYMTIDNLSQFQFHNYVLLADLPLLIYFGLPKLIQEVRVQVSHTL